MSGSTVVLRHSGTAGCMLAAPDSWAMVTNLLEETLVSWERAKRRHKEAKAADFQRKCVFRRARIHVWPAFTTETLGGGPGKGMRGPHLNAYLRWAHGTRSRPEGTWKQGISAIKGKVNDLWRKTTVGNFAFLVTWQKITFKWPNPHSPPKKCPHWVSIYLGTLLVCCDSSELSVSATVFTWIDTWGAAVYLGSTWLVLTRANAQLSLPHCCSLPFLPEDTVPSGNRSPLSKPTPTHEKNSTQHVVSIQAQEF